MTGIFFAGYGAANSWAPAPEHGDQKPPDAGVFVPLPEPVPQPLEQVRLGRALFHDPILSKNRNISCSSCHILDAGGDDNRAFPVSAHGQQGKLNSPSIFNLDGHIAYFWDGRLKSIEQQMSAPDSHNDAMGLDWETAVERLKDDKHYRELFQDAFGGVITEKTINTALISFERTLTTSNTAYDRFLKGNLEAISPRAQTGMGLFNSLGCASCHHGPLLGATMFQRMGVFHTYYTDPNDIRSEDLGRYNVTGDERDKFYFKVPSLRNVEMTAPYFHDGSAETLEDAVKAMAHFQLGQTLSDEDTASLVAFLKSLTGDRFAGHSELAQK